MTELPGQSLGGQPLSPPEMAAILAALDTQHTCIPAEVLADVPTASTNPPQALGDITSQLVAQPRPGDDALAARAYDEALRWLTGPDASWLLSPEHSSSTVLARADHNLTNFLWDGDRVRLIDFEYAGRADRCAEVACLVEHISARCTPDDAWRQFLDAVDLSRDERARLASLRRLFAAEWLFIMLPGQAGERLNPPGTLQRQAQRTLDLLES